MPTPELTLDSSHLSPQESAKQILELTEPGPIHEYLEL
jgi:hypothetical protein